MDGMTERGCFLFERNESFLASGHRHDAGSLPGEFQDKLPPDATGSSGHENAEGGERAAGHWKREVKEGFGLLLCWEWWQSTKCHG